MADTWTESVFNIVADFVDGGNREGLPSGETPDKDDPDYGAQDEDD